MKVPLLCCLLSISLLYLLQTSPTPSIFLINLSDTLQKPPPSSYSCLLDEINQGSCTLCSKQQALYGSFSCNSSSFPLLLKQWTTKQKVFGGLMWFRTLASCRVIIEQSYKVGSEVAVAQTKLVDGGGSCLVGLGQFYWFPGVNPKHLIFGNVAVGAAPVVGLPNRFPLLKSSLLNLSLKIEN